MLHALQKSRQISAIALDRLGDYLALMRIEMKLQGREMGLQVAGLLASALLFIFAMLFVGLAIIISFWDTNYRSFAAWAVVALYMGGAGVGLTIARQHAGKGISLTTLREEIKRDVELVKENL